MPANDFDDAKSALEEAGEFTRSTSLAAVGVGVVTFAGVDVGEAMGVAVTV